MGHEVLVAARRDANDSLKYFDSRVTGTNEVSGFGLSLLAAMINVVKAGGLLSEMSEMSNEQSQV